MKVVIAGGRDIVDAAFVFRTIEDFDLDITEVVCGCADGVDSIGEQWALDQGIPVKHFPANWKDHGKAAGPIRNAQMAHYGDALILIWDGQSKGSAGMKRVMESLSKPIHETIYKESA